VRDGQADALAGPRDDGALTGQLQVQCVPLP
jgi:hypothetical protein